MDWKLNPAWFRKMGPSRGRFVCNQDHKRNRCLSTGLVTQERVCEPSVVPRRQGTSPGSVTTSVCDTGGPGLEDPAMVLAPLGNASGLPSIVRADAPNSNQAGPANDSPSVGCMAYLREKYRNEKLSDEATTLLLKSRRVNTNKSYDSLFSKWYSWCDRRGSDPFSGPVSEVVNFLANLYSKGYKYNAKLL